ncbi:MAG: TRAP transporter substrate-binding protein DctP [Pseudomonadota bacterium]
MNEGSGGEAFDGGWQGPLEGRQLVLLAALLLGLPVLILALARIHPQATRQWDLSLPWSLNEFHTQNALRFAAAAQAASEGRVRITVHPGAALGVKGPDSLRAAADGVVPLVEMAGFQQVGSEPILGLEALPFLVDDAAELKLLYRFLRPQVDAAFARHGLKVLYLVPWPNQNLYTKTRVDNLAALAGVKIRTQDANTTALMARLGLSPVQMPAPDVVPALASGAVSATITSATTAAAQKYWAFLRYIYRTNHVWISNMLVVNLTAWNRLAAADRLAIERLARTMEPEFWAVSAGDDTRQMARLLSEGMIVAGPSPAMAAEMRAAARPLWRDFAARVPAARPILDAYLAATGRAPLDEPRP